MQKGSVCRSQAARQGCRSSPIRIGKNADGFLLDFMTHRIVD
jgi:hypothetical protein